ncbi:hypothetical protein H0H92_009501 [Tricholoma furcatifolium]|nr:hypothetical protein H0H92_009501 [Tricholoma furcatifolium]
MERYSAINMIQSPNLRKAMKDTVEDDSVLFESVLGIPSVANAKIMAATSSDVVWIDAEHTPYSPTLLLEVVRTFGEKRFSALITLLQIQKLKMYSQGSFIPIVGVPNQSHEWIASALDAGAGGVIIPHIETVEQVKSSIAAVRFPPYGHRSFPPLSVILGMQDTAPEGKTWLDVASEHCAVIPQIESRKGVENLEEIMQLPGVDGIMIGYSDLQLDTLAGACDNNRELEMEKMTARIRDLAKKYKMPLVGVAQEHQLVEKLAQGYRVLLYAVDVWILAYGIEKELKIARDTFEKVKHHLWTNKSINGSESEPIVENKTAT